MEMSHIPWKTALISISVIPFINRAAEMAVRSAEWVSGPLRQMVNGAQACGDPLLRGHSGEPSRPPARGHGPLAFVLRSKGLTLLIAKKPHPLDKSTS